LAKYVRLEFESGHSYILQVVAHVYRIEWQARGMPHAHCLFILRNKLLSPRHIDQVVWAEIPCPRKYPVLHAIVCKRMIHDPCDNNADALCLQKNGKGTCYRHFPKRLNNATTIIGACCHDVVHVFVILSLLNSGDGYPEYRRRGRTSSVRNGTVIDDRWVVPYNPFLLETFDAHINVEVAAHKRCFKYVYAYAHCCTVISCHFLCISANTALSVGTNIVSKHLIMPPLWWMRLNRI